MDKQLSEYKPQKLAVRPASSWWNPYDPDKLEITDVVPVEITESSIQSKVIWGMTIMLGLFLAWAFVAPLDAGVHVTGQVSVSDKRKEIAHPSGGVVQELFVSEGQRVEKGQVLLTVNPLNTEARLETAMLDYINALGRESRLMAEAADASAIVWLDELLEMGDKDPRIQQVMAAQTQTFESGRQERDQQRSIYVQRSRSLTTQLAELKSVLNLKREQVKSLSEDASSSRALASEGYVPKASANELERQRGSSLASLSSTISEISNTQSQLDSNRLELARITSTFKKEANDLLTEVRKERKVLRSQLDSLQFDRALAEVKSPVSGKIVGLKTNTVGGVIRGAEVLMEIVPEDSKLVIEAKVPPHHIDKVFSGMDADLRFTAFNANTTPVISGKVSVVGADLQPRKPGDDQDFYLAVVETDPSQIQKLGDVLVQAGMPVDVIVKNGQRTFASYLIKPLTDSVAISFKD